ncbi:unnamed protein product [Spirodela intermedia]|uniref:Protein kinase domain-containing protein n=1 Tax=Spirodela intermedia TaxID=51605 RepID=A0A7I8JTR5_SPIIN|nr:unnamed protein product [Spirodela intermedia]CAA6672842.1 unnamed protein product [Spirodela intermedia]
MTGFISIDCGLDGESGYTDKVTQILYLPDEPYTSAGVNQRVHLGTNLTSIMSYYANVRSFPDGVRNCYTLGPLVRGAKYRVKAEFLYGNYDGLGRPPTFDLYLGVNLWETVETGNYSRAEIIAVAAAEIMQVCLVNTGKGTPFISELDLRLLPDSMYPDDPYDRLWQPVELGNRIRTVARVNPPVGDEFPVPQAVLKTAATATSLSEGLSITIVGRPNVANYLFIYSAELQPLGDNETREFSIYAGDNLLHGPFRPSFLQAQAVYLPPPSQPQGLTYYLRATANSTLPPIINALEAFTLQHLTLMPTDEGEVEAISNLQDLYRVERNWVGDPCVPKNFTWEGLECSVNASNPSRITSLNLSHSGLGGRVPLSIANLTYVESLDLSYNNFTGEIPAYIENLSALKILNLESNNLSGNISKTLYKRSQDGSLLLRINNNPILCSTVDLCNATKKKKPIIIPIAVTVSASFLVLLLVVSIVCIQKRRVGRTQKNTQAELYMEQQAADGNRQSVGKGKRLLSESGQFSVSDVVRITNNFERPIGRGGFGTVYHGRLKDETQVAVKVVSKSSSQGAKEFRAEVSHSDSANKTTLSWRLRLRIALEAAQGLDYLHYGCKPPIVHRDVKPSNILLNENFEVKLADFGLSRSFTDEEATHISTVVAGSPGYLDPEYYKTTRLTEKSDVYSFGIVLLELVTGKPPIVNDSKRTHITQHVQSRLERGDIADITDQRMQGDYDVNSIWKVIEIALSCTSPNSSERPTMSTVVVQLKDYTLAIIPPHSMARISPSAR